MGSDNFVTTPERGNGLGFSRRHVVVHVFSCNDRVVLVLALTQGHDVSRILLLVTFNLCMCLIANSISTQSNIQNNHSRTR